MKIFDKQGNLLVDYGLHANEHEAGGSDEVSLGALSGSISDAQHGVRTQANAHAHSHLSGIGVNDHHARDHAATHLVGGADALSVGAPVAIGASNAQGSQTNFARRDHVHAHGTTIRCSGRFGLDRMPAGDSGKGLVGKGAGVDPAYEYVTHAKEGGRNIWVQAAAPTAIATGDIWIET